MGKWPRNQFILFECLKTFETELGRRRSKTWNEGGEGGGGGGVDMTGDSLV